MRLTGETFKAPAIRVRPWRASATCVSACPRLQWPKRTRKVIVAIYPRSLMPLFETKPHGSSRFRSSTLTDGRRNRRTWQQHQGAGQDNILAAALDDCVNATGDEMLRTQLRSDQRSEKDKAADNPICRHC